MKNKRGCFVGWLVSLLQTSQGWAYAFGSRLDCVYLTYSNVLYSFLNCELYSLMPNEGR